MKPTATSTTRALRLAAIPDPRLLLPRPFPLDRLTSILRVIHPLGLPSTKSISDRVAREIVELERLRFVVCDDNESNLRRDGGGGEGGLSERRWKINVSREVVEKMARGWGVGFAEWEIENAGGGGGGGGANGW